MSEINITVMMVIRLEVRMKRFTMSSFSWLSRASNLIPFKKRMT